MSSQVVASNSVVSIHYTLKDDSGETLDSSRGGEAMSYLHGASNIVPGLESALEGKSVGDSLDVVVEPSDGYGEREGPGPAQLPLDNFPDDVELTPGMMLMAQGDDDEVFPLWVMSVDESHAVVDHNHPLAGVTLHFAVEITDIRAATEEEIAHGHPHGPGGHHH